MAERQAGPAEVRPNTLTGQSEPNTFRGQTGSGTVAKQYLNAGGGNTARPSRLAVFQLPLQVYVAVAVLLVVVAVYLLFGAP